MQHNAQQRMDMTALTAPILFPSAVRFNCTQLKQSRPSVTSSGARESQQVLAESTLVGSVSVAVTEIYCVLIDKVLKRRASSQLGCCMKRMRTFAR